MSFHIHECATNVPTNNPNRNKAIQALQATLGRYDEEVGNERTRELQDLRDAFEMQKGEFALWKETINEPHIKL
jgi:hypothetical protein